ncbi:hydrogenase (NiFe) small subunit HydA [Oscillochloris trichoides DG-6]|uniref:Hydrogenase (NiFe) small subunit HydA n=1 Tax=Oscillochloris trichoides DG-6 TaxID=765420 RepID=E1IE81_9CHLR|nr:hydrogenase small subunit [Oscillochloris trichoides]EFO80541.1 hydrogenase (NiFe) small subunit HydA [Oscillochloris trichoides DG-6]
MPSRTPSLEVRLRDHGISRREFLKFCGLMAATLALPASFTPKIAKAMNTAARIPVVWLEFQDCAGNTESFLRSGAPTAAEIVLEQISLDYHETIMAPAGAAAERSLEDVVTKHKGQYIAIVEGSIPTKDGGIYCVINGHTALDIARNVCGNAMATIAVGACAWDGGVPAAGPNPTGAVGVGEAVPGLKSLINMPGCPMNVVNLTALIVHFLTFKALPATDPMGRPLFAYGQLIHNNCERRGHFDAGRFVENWGDEGHRMGYCLYKMGCKGPQTYSNCPAVQWNEGTSWPIGAGHGCVGCMSPKFWDYTTPFYERIPQLEGFGVEATADMVGAVAVGAVAVGVAGHAVASAIRSKAQPAGARGHGDDE